MTTGREDSKGWAYLPRGSHVPNNWVLGVWVIVIIVHVLGKYMIIRGTWTLRVRPLPPTWRVMGS